MLVGRAKRPRQPNGTPPVAASRPSYARLWIAPSAAAASATVRACGPIVSCVCEIGTTPARLVSPTVGLMATTPFALPGQTILPSVSEPNDTVAKFADAAAPEPELEPQALRSMPYGLCVCPPRPDQPLIDSNERKFAHSDRVVLPRITAPPARRLAATVESCIAGVPTSANDPALVCIPSPVSMLSFKSTGMPCRGPSTTPRLRSSSALRAMASASGLSSMMELTPGPLESSAWMRSMYARVSRSEVSRPAAISACSCATVASRNVNPSSDSPSAASGESSSAVTKNCLAMRDIVWFLLRWELVPGRERGQREFSCADSIITAGQDALVCRQRANATRALVQPQCGAAPPYNADPSRHAWTFRRARTVSIQQSSPG